MAPLSFFWELPHLPLEAAYGSWVCDLSLSASPPNYLLYLSCALLGSFFASFLDFP